MSGASLFDDAPDLDAPGAWVESIFLCLDFETTGTDPFLARPVSVAAVLLGPDGWSEGDTLIVDAGVDIPESAAAIHGITEQRVEEHGIHADEVRATVEGVGRLPFSRIEDERGKRVQIVTSIQDRPVLVLLYPAEGELGTVWNLGSAYFIDE